MQTGRIFEDDNFIGPLFVKEKAVRLSNDFMNDGGLIQLPNVKRCKNGEDEAGRIWVGFSFGHSIFTRLKIGRSGIFVIYK